MDEDGNSSWIRRTKYSHTIYHRTDSAKFASVPFTVQREHNSGLKSRPGGTSSAHNSGLKSRPGETSSIQKAEPQAIEQIPRNLALNKQRSLSPLPQQTMISSVFKEAQSDKKRFLTPHPRNKGTEKGIMGKLFHKDTHETRTSLASMKYHEKTKSRKESSWTKYFDNGSGKVNAVESADEWTVDLSKLFIGLSFAHGAHSRLYHGLYKDEPVALKIVRIPDNDENGTMEVLLEKQYNREASLLSRLHHMNVIKFKAAWRNPPVLCIITEYLPEGSLRAHLHKLEHKSMGLQKLIGFALDIARGMEFIHSQGVIHRDLKPENILIDQEFRMKLADFGIACEVSNCDSLVDDPGTYRWMAPEMIKGKAYGRKVDVYSFGLILWEMLTGSIPYETMTPPQAAFAVVNKFLRPEIPGDCPPAMRALIERCWHSKQEKRPEFWQIVKVLEQFESSLARDGALSLVQNPTRQDPKKGLLHWIHKLDHPTHAKGSIKSKPKIT